MTDSPNPARRADTLSCIVVGAGISGLLAARELVSAGWRVVVLEEGRGVGGRMATRRFGGGVFDHGAQFFTARSDDFESLVYGWIEAGAAGEWSRGFAGPEGERPPDGHPRYRGASGMASVPKLLAEGLDTRTNERVVEVGRDGNGWRIRTETGLTESAEALLMTPPAPRSLALVSDELSPDERRALEAITYDPCLALMALLDGPVGLPKPGGVQIHGELLDWISDNRMKGISAEPSLTIHAGPGWSREHFDDPEEDVVRSLLQLADEWLGINLAAKAVETSLVRWRYSWVTQNRPERFFVATESPPLVFCGDGFGGAKVEGASLSGLAAAGWLLGRYG